MPAQKATDEAKSEWLAEVAPLLVWDPPRTVNTSRGERRLLTADPTEEFLGLALANKKLFKACGFSLSRSLRRRTVCAQARLSFWRWTRVGGHLGGHPHGGAPRSAPAAPEPGAEQLDA